VLTRSIAETAQLLDILAGYEPGDATWAPPSPTPFAELAEADPGSRHVGLALNPPLDGEDGLPLAVQLIGRPLAEGTLLSLGTQLERALPWAERLSPLARA
jgi:amidase